MGCSSEEDYNRLIGFEQEFHTKIGEDFRDRIACAAQMQDFRLEDMYYERNKPDSSSPRNLSTLRITFAYPHAMWLDSPTCICAMGTGMEGKSSLRTGSKRTQKRVPVTLMLPEKALDTDYLWWVHGFALPVKKFYEHCVLGEFVVMIPERDMVVVVLSRVEIPDNWTLTAEEFRNLPGISVAQMAQLLELLLAAQRT